MDSDLLSNCGLRLESEIYIDGVYSLCRVDYQGRKLVAEVSPASGVYQHRWPSVGGLLSPVSARDLPGQQKLVLFDIGERFFLCEVIAENGRISSPRAAEITKKALGIVSDLQAAGMICGYLGPEMFVIGETNLMMLAGRRGIPVSPFTPPELQSSRPSDPRSDVSAIGSFLFRLVAGTDIREEQLRVWQQLSPAFQTAIQDMVAASPVDRPNGLRSVAVILDNLIEDGQSVPDEEVSESTDDSLSDHAVGFGREKSGGAVSSRSRKLYWIAGSVVILVLAIIVFATSGPPPQTDPVPVESRDTTSVVSPWSDSVPEQIPESEQEEDIPQEAVVVPIEDSARVWISNCSGVDGLETEFRGGAVSDYSYVYPLTGTTSRQSSLILVRRSDTAVPSGESALWEAACRMADTSFTVKPVDLTIMLGTDLNYPGINSQFFRTPEAPAGTLFVDVVNHGIQYSLENMGAATWVASRIDGKSCRIDDVEWLISVSDIRDADKFCEEIGVPEFLDETIFLFKENNFQASILETQLRNFFQALPSAAGFAAEAVPVPDLHILIGRVISG